ncbi:acyl-CoA thioesterase [Pelagibacteraceae bacterium]|nr:acyl-CoA thioesterase [Pelagibacteraceae bacterium]
MSLKKNLSWDFNNPHILEFKVNKNDIDILGHVNNKVYLDWSEAVSWDHSKFLGVSHKDFQKVKCACVVVKNDIEYLGSLFLNDEVAISTWITKCDYKIKLSRLFQAVRIRDDKTVFRSKVDYVCISLENYKPKKFPDLFKKTYKVTTE